MRLNWIRLIAGLLVGLAIVAGAGLWSDNSTERGSMPSASPGSAADSGRVLVTEAPAGPVRPRQVLGLIDALRRARAGKPRFRRDGIRFENREGLLPDGRYTEWTIPTPGVDGRGPRRLVLRTDSRAWYTWNHYAAFVEVIG